jgi:hypothetical protein
MTQKILAVIIRAGKTIMAAAAMYFVVSIVPLDALQISSPDVIMFTTIATVVSQEPLIGISPLLQEKLGIRLGRSTIAKLFSPAIGQGCAPAAYWNKRPLYRPSDIITWAKARLRPGPGMTQSAGETPADDIPAKSGTAVRIHHDESLNA